MKYIPGFGMSLPLQDGSKVEIVTESLARVTLRFFPKDAVEPTFEIALHSGDARHLAESIYTVANKSGPGVSVQGE